MPVAVDDGAEDVFVVDVVLGVVEGAFVVEAEVEVGLAVVVGFEPPEHVKGRGPGMVYEVRGG